MGMEKILVIDDDPTYVEFLTELLTAEKYEVSGAMSGLDALKIIKRNRFDLIILDLIMPDVDGFQVCREIRESKRNHDAMIIMVTGKRMGSHDLMKGLEMGADEYLLKPVSPGELLARVRAMIRVRKLQDEVAQLESRSSWKEGMKEMLSTLGEYLARSSTTISSLTDYSQFKSREDVETFQTLIGNETKSILIVLETLQKLIKKLDSETSDVTRDEIFDIEANLRERMEQVGKK